MNNNEILNEYFIWEEKNYTKQNQNNYKPEEKDNYVIMNETKNDLINNDWKNITDPKLKQKAYKKDWYEKNKNTICLRGKVYREANKYKIKLRDKVYREVNKDKIKLQRKVQYDSNKESIKNYYKLNKERFKLRKQNYYKLNKEHLFEKRKLWYEKNKNNIQYKLTRRLRERLGIALKNNQKVGSAIKDLGCSIDELKVYLESKFLPGMTWDNYGLYGWHIDHIKPLASFDLSDRKQMLEACHYTNLQPLWATDNLSKGDKII